MKSPRQIQKSLSDRDQCPSRDGFLSVEMTLTLPILLTVIFAMVEFSFLFLARGELITASRAAARKATYPGVQPEDIETEVRSLLTPRLRNNCRIESSLGRFSGETVAVRINVPMGQASPNLLWPIGFNLEGRNLTVETRMIRE